MLSPDQVAHYWTFGYVILRNYFTPGEVARMQHEADAELAHQYRHHPFDGTQRHFCCMLDDRVPTFAGLLEDPRFLDVADQLHGESLPVWCDANRYVDPVTGWHPDLPVIERAIERAGVKFCHYLQPHTALSGALRVIPGSHRRPMHEEVVRFLTEHRTDVEAVPAVACETHPGDVIAFHQALYHAACHGARDRRLCTIAYYPMPAPGDTASLRQMLATTLPQTRQGFGWQGEVYPRSWIAKAASDPRRRLVVERMHRVGLFSVHQADAALAAEICGVRDRSAAVSSG